MNPRTLSRAGVVVALLGAVAVAVGAWLPWLIVRPGYNGPVPAVYLPGMRAGLGSLDWFVLLGAAVALVGVVPVSVPRFDGVGAALVGILAGGVVVVLTVFYLFSTVGSFLGTFVPGVGFYLTALGGVHLAAAGVLRAYVLKRRRSG